MLDSECGPGFRGERAKSENQGLIKGGKLCLNQYFFGLL